jgi:hypothetical protein
MTPIYIFWNGKIYIPPLLRSVDNTRHKYGFPYQVWCNIYFQTKYISRMVRPYGGDKYTMPYQVWRNIFGHTAYYLKIYIGAILDMDFHTLRIANRSQERRIHICTILKIYICAMLDMESYICSTYWWHFKNIYCAILDMESYIVSSVRSYHPGYILFCGFKTDMKYPCGYYFETQNGYFISVWLFYPKYIFWDLAEI